MGGESWDPWPSYLYIHIELYIYKYIKERKKVTSGMLQKRSGKKERLNAWTVRLDQGCQTCGPHAARKRIECGLRDDFFLMLCMRPANGFNAARQMILAKMKKFIDGVFFFRQENFF